MANPCDVKVMKKYRILCLLISYTLIISLPSNYAQQRKINKAAAPSSARGNIDYIVAEQLKDYLTFIASDELEGRDTPSSGLDIAAKFIAANLSRWGVKPAGDDGTYFQQIALKSEKVNPEQTRMEFNGRTVDPANYVPASAIAGAASGGLVYGGHGWLIKWKDIDPYKDIDVRDKIVVLLGNAYPQGMSFADFGGKKPGVDYLTPENYALQKGARGILFIPGFASVSDWAGARRNYLDAAALSVERFASDPTLANPAKLPLIIPSLSLVNALFSGEKVTGQEIFQRKLSNDAGASFALDTNKTVSFTVSTKAEKLRTQNVVGMIEGSDPLLKNEYVAIGAHYDHVGRGAANPSIGRFTHAGVKNDDIWNGADDDGSGTVAVMAIAEAFVKSNVRPKRSILFIWHAAEEKGLWGSEYFAQYPTIPLNQVISQLNIDMIGRTKKEGDMSKANKDLAGPNEIFVVGSKVMSTDLGELSERVNRSYLNLSFNYKYDDPNDPEKIFFRSDHYNYARKGVPIIFYTDGVYEDYHTPADQIEKIDFVKMEKVTRTIFATAWELANVRARPRVDKPLP